MVAYRCYKSIKFHEILKMFDISWGKNLPIPWKFCFSGIPTVHVFTIIYFAFQTWMSLYIVFWKATFILLSKCPSYNKNSIYTYQAETSMILILISLELYFRILIPNLHLTTLRRHCRIKFWAQVSMTHGLMTSYSIGEGPDPMKSPHHYLLIVTSYFVWPISTCSTLFQ